MQRAIPRPVSAAGRPGSVRGGEERRGTAIVETAIVLSFVFIPLLLGFFEFSRVMQAGQVVTTAARYGVRSAILDGSTEADVRLQVREFVASTMNVAQSDVTVTFDITTASGNPAASTIEAANSKDLIEVTVSVMYEKISVVNGKFMNGKPVTASAAMRHE